MTRYFRRIIRITLTLGILFSSMQLSLAEEDVETKSFDDLYLEGLRLKLKGDHNEAVEAFEAALAIDSTSSAALYELSRYYLYTQQGPKAFESLEKAVEHNPENVYYKLALANLCRESGQFIKAIDLYEELAAKYPDRIEIHFYLSELYLRTHQIDKAIGSLNNLENNMGMSEMITMQKYQLYRILGQDENALNEMEKLSAKFPFETRYLIIIGDYYLEKGKQKEALNYYEKAHALDANSPYYFISMANYYEQTGDQDSAYREIENAMKSPLLDINTKLDITVKYVQMILTEDSKNTDRIYSLIETLQEQHPQEKTLNLIYGEFLVSQGKTEEAKFQFKLVIEVEPDNKSAWTHLLKLAIQEENHREIITLCNDALVHFPDVPEFYFYKGMAYFIEKDYQSALDVFSTAVKEIPPANTRMLSEFYGQIGDLHHLLGDMTKTYEAYDKALEYNENNLMVLNNYAYFLALDKSDLDKAERMSAKTIQAEPDNTTYIDTYAWIFYQKGNYSLAKFYIESAISKSNGNASDELKEHYREILTKYEENK